MPFHVYVLLKKHCRMADKKLGGVMDGLGIFTWSNEH